MSDFIIPGEKPKEETYKDEVVFIPNSALESNDSTLQEWLLMEITPEKYYEATISENRNKPVYFKNDLGHWKSYKRQFFETKQERRDKKIEILLNIDN
jgi:hypothetical protein